MENIKELEKILLRESKNIVITSHKNPDGDAVGASLGLMFFLRKYKNNVSIILPNSYPDFLEWMPEANNIYVYDKTPDICDEKISKAEIIFCLDYNDLDRVGNMKEEIEKNFLCKKVMIDHHKNPEDFCDYVYSDISMCSTSEMIYHFIEDLDELTMIDKYISICLYTGIMTDSGSFRFPSVTSKTHKILSHLLDHGIDIEEIHNNVYDNNDLERFKLLGIALGNMKVIGNRAYTYISSDNFSSIKKYNSGYTEGFVNYCLKLKNVNLACIFIEKKDENIIKISLRSKGEIDVDKIAKKYFNGGGHKNASGGMLKSSLEDAIKLFEKIN